MRLIISYVIVNQESYNGTLTPTLSMPLRNSFTPASPLLYSTAYIHILISNSTIIKHYIYISSILPYLEIFTQYYPIGMHLPVFSIASPTCISLYISHTIIDITIHRGNSSCSAFPFSLSSEVYISYHYSIYSGPTEDPGHPRMAWGPWMARARGWSRTDPAFQIQLNVNRGVMSNRCKATTYNRTV